MDQDFFRGLLQTPRPGDSTSLGSASGSRGVVVPPKKKTVHGSQPAFKPRNVKKTKESTYRDRAAERRGGNPNDYAHIEAVLEDFEKQNADEDREKVEAQRKYLGGDSEHSILVKGLDFALLEQNKVRSGLTSDDVDALDQAFLESSSTGSTVPKKRTRAELLQELKAQRTGQSSKSGTAALSTEEVASVLGEAKQKGKFKPIGFKPIAPPEGKKKKKKVKTDSIVGDGEKKRKKAKIEGAKSSTSGNDSMLTPSALLEEPQTVNPSNQEPVDEEFDIFADAGDYKGIETDDDDEEAIKPQEAKEPLEEGEEPSVPPKRWIETDEASQPMLPKPKVPPPPLSSSSRQPTVIHPTSRISPHLQQGSDNESMEEEERDRPMRLEPLSSSALPSIKDLLAMDKAAGSYAKNRKRKEKKKKNGGGGGADDDDDDDDDNGNAKKKSAEAKADRDYKRLKSYTDKKGAQ